MPSACAAATWPRGTDWMPARMISAKYAASRTSIASVRGNCGFGADKSGYGNALLDIAHREGHDDIDDDVDDRRRSEGLEHLEREFLHGAGARRELHEPDGERDRAVLDDIEKFGRQRRQDDAIGHRQQHVDVGLRWR